ncbi:ATP cone domain-containing protein [Paenimyroides aquimaris]|uniref:ATP cone domain-containing protein n=1 Tax=Paenimyroides marinum TaxID=1159016 RepID=A0A1H6K1L2_9FLAO|nr:ATP cone domain-containing protein [Paenimyroides aquimaris]SEH66199.1 ATP cone domain-containing protein [Paenimyroides aquimaris]
MSVLITKQSGETAPFSKDSLRKSLLNSGADEIDAEKICQKIEKEIYNGITTKELYEKAFKLLKEIRSSIAARYSLKRALQDLGPEGFYFEKWVAKVFEVQGYDTITGQQLTGESLVNHEIDVVISNRDTDIVCECKFRNDIDAKISVTTPMYFLSRFNDLKNREFTFFNRSFKPNKGFLITNAFFTSDSIAFAECYHINLISWNYPEEYSIKKLTDKQGLYPITCLTTLTKEEEKILLSKNCILVRELVRNPVLLDHFKFSDDRKKIILNEAKELLAR